MPVANRKNIRKAFPKLTESELNTVVRLIGKAYRSHSGTENAMDTINFILGGHGVEAIRGDYVGPYWFDTEAIYVNMGDTYKTTVLYDTLKGKFYVDSWGDWYERAERQGRVGEFKP